MTCWLVCFSDGDSRSSEPKREGDFFRSVEEAAKPPTIFQNGNRIADYARLRLVAVHERRRQATLPVPIRWTGCLLQGKAGTPGARDDCGLDDRSRARRDLPGHADPFGLRLRRGPDCRAPARPA